MKTDQIDKVSLDELKKYRQKLEGDAFDEATGALERQALRSSEGYIGCVDECVQWFVWDRAGTSSHAWYSEQQGTVRWKLDLIASFSLRTNSVEADYKKFDLNGDGHLLLEEYLESHGLLEFVQAGQNFLPWSH